MVESQKPKVSAEADVLAAGTAGPLVFISHDSRDAELAEAFSKLLKSVSAGMIKTFQSSGKKESEGIDFGHEWYKQLMATLQSTSDVICLFTERSLDRPWILFEAGVAKGKLNTPVVGVAIGVPLARVSAGPFYQFQNMTASESDLTKLVNQLARRVPSLELDAGVVKFQVQAFKTTEAAILKSLAAAGGKKAPADDTDESPVAKLVEEMKALPSRVAERLAEAGDPLRRQRIRRFHPMMFEELMERMEMVGGRDDPTGILVAASFIRDDLPWLYELAMEVYRAVKLGDAEAIEREMTRLRQVVEFAMHGPLMEMLGDREDSFRFAMEFPRLLERSLRRRLEIKKTHPRRRAAQRPSEQA
jgi:hypothetical protein